MVKTELPELPQPNLDGYENDSQADREVQNFKYLEELSKAKHDNALAIHKTIKFLIPCALVVSFIAFSALSTVYILHLLLPLDRRWLSPDEIQHIHSMIFSGIVGGAIAILGKMYLGDVRKS